MADESTEKKELEEITPEQIMEDIAVGAAAHSAATEAFVDNFMFYDKSLNEWSDQLAVPIAGNPTPLEIRKLYIKLANNIQVASHFYSVSNTINGTIVGGGQIKKSDLVTALVHDYERRNAKRPAREVLERMADSYMKSTVSTRVASKIVKEFWKQRLDSLIEVRKCLESISMSVAMEMKYLGDHDG
jgi:hypothetical protein